MNSEVTDEQIKKHITVCANLGLKSALKEIKEGTVNTETELIKVNLPDSSAKFISGNGEGIWAALYDDKAKDIYAKSTLNEEFEVVTLNSALTYPFPWGSRITVVLINTDGRPVLSKDWISKVIAESTKGETTLEIALGECCCTSK